MLLTFRTSPLIKILLVLLMAFFLMGCEKDELVFWEEEAAKVIEDVVKKEKGVNSTTDEDINKNEIKKNLIDELNQQPVPVTESNIFVEDEKLDQAAPPPKMISDESKEKILFN
jgi:hypothetical protein